MARGNNRQRIFDDEVDYLKMEKILRNATSAISPDGLPQKPHCVIYAYCLMPNHIHLLIKEGDEGIDIVLKRILVSYASYYNKRTQRIGSLFQGRFLSQPVNDEDYYQALLDYIHLNPVEAKIVKHPKDYKWSSWRYFEMNKAASDNGICTIEYPFGNMSRDELCSIVLNMPPKKVKIDERQSIPDHEAIAIVESLLPPGVKRFEVKTMPLSLKQAIYSEATRRGIAMRQLSRILNINVSNISRTLAQ